MILNEIIYGNKATVYHRTKLKVLKSIIANGFYSGIHGAYGKGIYANYELENALQDRNIKNYGDILIKSIANIYGCLIFDTPIAKLIYNTTSLASQAKILNLTNDYELLKHIDDMKTASDQKAKEYLLNAKQLSHINGLVYTNKTDGKCCVFYDTRNIIPVAYAHVDINNAIAFASNPKWIKINSYKDILISYLNSSDIPKNTIPRHSALLQNKSIHQYKIEKAYELLPYMINGTFDITNDGIVVNGNVNLYTHIIDFRNYLIGNTLPFNFLKVSGNFDCSDLGITSLKGCPEYVGGNFICQYNNLNTLKYLPKIINGNCYILNNIPLINKEHVSDIHGTITIKD